MQYIWFSDVKHTTVSYTHLRAHETDSYLVCRLLLEKKNGNRRKLNVTKSDQ